MLAFRRPLANFDHEEAPNDGFDVIMGDEDEYGAVLDALQNHRTHDSVDKVKQTDNDTDL